MPQVDMDQPLSKFMKDTLELKRLPNYLIDDIKLKHVQNDCCSSDLHRQILWWGMIRYALYNAFYTFLSPLMSALSFHN